MKALFVATVLAVAILPSVIMARGKALDPPNVPDILIYNPNGDGL